MTEALPQNNSMRAVLANLNFRQLWIGQTISQVGDGLTNLAILIVINKLTGSTTALAVMMVIMAVPQLVFGLISGVFVDRWDRKRIMIISDLLRGLLVLGFILVRRPEEVWIFYVLGFLQAMVGTFFNPAKSAMIPTIVEREALLAANALSQTTQVITGVIGSALAGVLVGLSGSAWPAFTLDSLSFFLSAFFITRVAAPQLTERIAGGLGDTFTQLGEGLKYLFGQRTMIGVMTTFAVTMLGVGSVNVLIVPFLINHLKVPTEAMGFIEAAQVIGMVLGSVLVGVLAARLKANQIIVGGVMLVGVFIGLFGASPVIGFGLVALFFVGLFITPVQAAAATLLQALVPNEIRGRASSAMNTVITLASVISMGSAGILGDWLGVRQVFYLAGGITIFASLLAALLIRSPRPVTQSVVAPPAD
jgi:MFS family permease